MNPQNTLPHTHCSLARLCTTHSSPDLLSFTVYLWRLQSVLSQQKGSQNRSCLLLCGFCSQKLFIVRKHRLPKEDRHRMAPFPASQNLQWALLLHWSYGARIMALPVKSHYNYEKCLQLFPPFRQSLWLPEEQRFKILFSIKMARQLQRQIC